MEQSLNAFIANRAAIMFDKFSLQMNLTKFTIPGVSIGIPDGEASSRNTPLGGGALEFDELSITFIVDEYLNNFRALYDWLRKSNFESFSSEDLYSDAAIIIYNNYNNEIGRIKFSNVLIKNVSSIDIDHSIAEAEPVETTATFMYSDMVIEIN